MQTEKAEHSSTTHPFRELGIKLIDIHSQHQNLLLANEDFQLRAIDTIAQDSTQLSDYQNTYSSYIEVKKELEQAKKELEDIRRSEELLRFQFQELSAAQLDNCSQEELEQESKTMSHEEDIKRELYATEEGLTNEGTGALSQLRQPPSDHCIPTPPSKRMDFTNRKLSHRTR